LLGRNGPATLEEFGAGIADFVGFIQHNSVKAKLKDLRIDLFGRGFLLLGSGC
jgi:hypothetical protein